MRRRRNKCWGLVSKQFAATGTIGDHSSDPPGFEPGEGGRDGVGNVSKTGLDNETEEPFGELSEGAQGAHAIDVGEDMGLATPAALNSGHVRGRVFARVARRSLTRRVGAGSVRVQRS